jgi:uncharacterized protein
MHADVTPIVGTAALAGVALYAAACLVIYLWQDRLIYRRSRRKPDRARAGLDDMLEVRLLTDDGVAIYAWYKSPANGRKVLLYLPGAFGHVGHRGKRLRCYLKQGFGCLILAYRGFSGNGGRPTEPGLVSDGAAAVLFLERHGIPSSQIVLYGESLGAAVAVRLATRFPVAGLVLEAPFSSLLKLAAEKLLIFPVGLMLRDRFLSADVIADVHCPVLIFHGTKDRITRSSHANLLFVRANAPKMLWRVVGAGHFDLYNFGADAAVVDFLDRLSGAQPNFRG